ncbi:venom carboxylesterase-6-like [Phymastichus coffea]|uniref:venom carboxylesterase-6-like n=1 Tax=Phymastichus coffea TaxID=108790 RepID=UPI00273CC341|nr:venom carboxylesterase-6-like [Phymastichus coffea]
MHIANIIFSLFLLLIKLSLSKNFPSVKSHLGEIKGHYKISNRGNNYEAYEGIPYAKPPIGNRRFMPPEPMQPWKGEIVANTFHDMCIGYNRDFKENEYVRGVEDCLYMNIYTPIKKNNTSLPVILWIYAGGFQFATIGGTEQHYLIDHDVIFISFNYRHGTLGFLSTEDEVVAGNMGLKDQAMALKWVSDNIECFGGDPKKITLAGLSAGAASVHYHYLSPMSKGLFRSGISFSGTAFNSWTQAKNSREKAIKLGKLMNCPIGDIINMVDCLRTRSAYDIVSAQINFMPWHLNEFSPFGPVIEEYTPDPFINRSPIDVINTGDVYDAPWITGVVKEEGLYAVAEFVTNETAFQELNDNWNEIAPQLLQFYYTIPKKDHASVSQKIRKHYFGDQLITRGNFINLTHLNGDRVFVVDAEKAARAQAKVNRSPVWFYYYSYRARSSLSDSMSNTTENFGVSHADDVLLILGNHMINPTNNDRDFAMHGDLLKFWLSVAREGAPNFGPQWSSINPNDADLKYLHMRASGDFKEESNNNLGEKIFWETIDFNENKPY